MQYACCMTRFLSGNHLKAQKFVVQVQVYHWWLNIWISIINNTAPALSVIWKRLYTITYWYYWYHCITDVTDTTDTTDIQMSLIYHIIHLIYWYISSLIFTRYYWYLYFTDKLSNWYWYFQLSRRAHVPRTVLSSQRGRGHPLVYFPDFLYLYPPLKIHSFLIWSIKYRCDTTRC